MDILARQEQQVDRYIEHGQNERAVKLLYELILSHAKSKDFAKAENLREKLIRVDSMALREIVNSAEVIESEKAETIDVHQRGLWKKLYDTLTAEERNAFYLAAKQKNIAPDRMIIKQGTLNDKLFFINRGRLKLIYRQGEKENYVKQINAGEIAGQDSFFSISLCTTSVITISNVQLCYLDRSSIQKLEGEFPGFETKLHDFCFKSGENIIDILKKKEIERRCFKRFEVAGKIATQLLDKSGKPVVKAFQGHLKDISEGGVSYFIKCSQKSSARFLLGRPADIKMSFSKNGDESIATARGRIVGVKYRLFNDYTVHLKFTDLFPEAQIIKWSIPPV